jgi:DNA-binding SARP family transcriptional activator
VAQVTKRESQLGLVGDSPALSGALPPISDRAVPRPRVTDFLAERITKQPLVQVVASAGSGKTTAVVGAVEKVDRSLTWLTLDEWHRSPGRLVEDLVAALEPVAPGLARVLGMGGDVAPAQLAAAIGAFVRRQHALLVLDDCHVLTDAPEAHAILGVVVRRAAPGLHVVLVGRTLPPLAGLGLEAFAPEAMVGDEVLRATPEEAEEILRAHGSSVAVDEAMEATTGWVAGLVFETWRAQGGGVGSDDPLRNYVEREVLPRLAAQDGQALVAASVFERVDTARAEALGVDDPRAWFVALREAGLPAVWATGGVGFRLHPRIRELLREELDTGPSERFRAALQSAAAAYEREGNLERALDLFLEIGDTAAAERLLPEVIVDVVDRHDVALAERYLAAVRFDPEPPRVVLARLMIGSFKADSAALWAVLESLEAERRLLQMVADEPRIGPTACMQLAWAGHIDTAAELLETMPPGRPAGVARMVLSCFRDDPGAPVSAFAGDFLDAPLARALFSRGLFAELREGRSTWALMTGVPAIGGVGGLPEAGFQLPRFVGLYTSFGQSIQARDYETARVCRDELAALPTPWGALSEAEFAIRLERDSGLAHQAIERLYASGHGRMVAFRELAASWEGAAELLADEPHAAAEVLREAVASMRHGDRRLALARALVYLAEAEWRLGNEEASDRATEDAYAVARSQGSLRELLLSLADFPGVLSRRLDAEPGAESAWHLLGRALVADSRAAGVVVHSPATVHLREFGEPALLVEGRDARPKIRKSLELLSYLLASTGREVSREEALTALWNGRDDDSARAYLRQALRHLREALPEGVAIEARDDALIVEGAVTCESLELEALLAEAARDPGPGRLGYLLEALELAGRGLFLAHSSNVDWIDDRRAQIASVLADARLDAAEFLLGADRHLRALALVDEALDADPLSERAWRIRMRTLGLLGDYDGVTAAYAACTSALAEIGLEPSTTTSALARALRR